MMSKRKIIPAILFPAVVVAIMATGGCTTDAPHVTPATVSEPVESAAPEPQPEPQPEPKPEPRFLVRSTKALSLAETAGQYENSPWKKVATDEDQDRIYSWVEALYSGVAGSQLAGEGQKIKQAAGLFEVDAVLDDSAMPPGLYNCAITKLGGLEDRGLSFIAYPAFRCRVTEEGERLHFTKLTGSQRTVGWIYRASNRHSVYLGTAFYGYEDKAIPYGETKERDQAAVVQRIGKGRWRMVFPYPYYESVVNVMELTPIME